MADTNQRPRGGMTLEAISFRQGVFSPWAEKFRDVSPTGWVSQIWRERQAALKIAQVRHEQNEMVRIAKVTGKQPVLAEPAVRQSVARNQQRELAQIHHRINAVAEQAAAARAKLKLIDHRKPVAYRYWEKAMPHARWRAGVSGGPKGRTMATTSMVSTPPRRSRLAGG
jgi:hypothetical protein